ncbi:MAG: hypothetical protein COT73_11630 [Bdellovibrio sp. CG10_big_fil_rev_8_21_14_0_10_47_8]|nr:MAG: hypothetical protein COT73_11630 [Bdellovibrio sp. CG10_big_fil_rev_8_21_14_0_10_47_8]
MEITRQTPPPDENLSPDSGNLTARFARGADQMMALLKTLGGARTPPCNPSFLYFRQLTPEARHKVITMLETTLGVCTEMMAEKSNPKNGGVLAWRVLKKMGFQPLSDAFQSYSEGDIVEIYNHHHQMVFASLNVFDSCSYTLEDLYCRPWIELWERDPKITALLFEKAIYVTSPECHETLFLNIPAHQVRETSSHEMLRGSVSPKIFSPVINERGDKGFLSINQVCEAAVSTGRSPQQDQTP